jgi:hypothetical protein
MSRSSAISDRARWFHDEGFFVLESVVPAGQLEALRSECGRFVRARDAEMDRLGVDAIDLDHRGSRYFVHAWGKSDPVRRFLLSDLMVEIAQAALGERCISSTSSMWSRPRSAG